VLVDIVAVILPLLFATQPSSFWVDSNTFVPNWLTSSSGLINLRLLLRILQLQRVLQDMDTVALGISDSKDTSVLGDTVSSTTSVSDPIPRQEVAVFTLVQQHSRQQQHKQ
jgi:hypothetical protein